MADEQPRSTPDQSDNAPGGIAQSKRVEDEEIKPYVLTGELGKGSFAVVYKGYHQVFIFRLLPVMGFLRSCFAGDPRAGGDQDRQSGWP